MLTSRIYACADRSISISKPGRPTSDVRPAASTGSTASSLPRCPANAGHRTRNLYFHFCGTLSKANLGSATPSSSGTFLKSCRSYKCGRHRRGHGKVSSPWKARPRCILMTIHRWRGSIYSTEVWPRAHGTVVCWWLSSLSQFHELLLRNL